MATPQHTSHPPLTPDPGDAGRAPRVAVVTGGSQGLGFELARDLAARGWAVVIDARRADRLDAAVARLREGGARVVGVAGDVTDPTHRAALVEAAWRLGRTELLVNNASTLGASPLPRLEDLPLDVLRRTFEVNVVAPLALAQAFLPLLAPDGAVVNVTSDAAVEAYPGWGGYGASKAALEQLSAVLAAEHPDLRVLVVDPGDLRTEMHQDAFPGEDISDRPLPGRSAAAMVALVEGGGPSGRHRAATLAPEATPEARPEARPEVRPEAAVPEGAAR